MPDIHIHVHLPSATVDGAQLDERFRDMSDTLTARIDAEVAKIGAFRSAMLTGLEKIAGEQAALVAKVAELSDELAAAGAITPAVQARLDALSTQVTSLDTVTAKLRTIDESVPDVQAPAA